MNGKFPNRKNISSSTKLQNFLCDFFLRPKKLHSPKHNGKGIFQEDLPFVTVVTLVLYFPALPLLPTAISLAVPRSETSSSSYNR